MSAYGYQQTSQEDPGTSAYPPTGDIHWPMSVIVLISSALPPTADILDKAGNISS